MAVISIISLAMGPNPRTAAIYYFITALFILLACFDTYFALPLNVSFLRALTWQHLVKWDSPSVTVLLRRSQIEGLSIFRKFSILPAVIWAYPFINFHENFQPPCFFTYTNEKNSTLPAVIRAYPLIENEEKIQFTRLLELPPILET